MEFYFELALLIDASPCTGNAIGTSEAKLHSRPSSVLIVASYLLKLMRGLWTEIPGSRAESKLVAPIDSLLPAIATAKRH